MSEAEDLLDVMAQLDTPGVRDKTDWREFVDRQQPRRNTLTSARQQLEEHCTALVEEVRAVEQCLQGQHPGCVRQNRLDTGALFNHSIVIRAHKLGLEQALLKLDAVLNRLYQEDAAPEVIG